MTRNSSAERGQYTHSMDLNEIVQAIDAEIMRLEQVRALLTPIGTHSDSSRTGPPQPSGTPRVQTRNADPTVRRKSAPATLIAAIVFAALAIAYGTWLRFRTEVPANRPATLTAASSPDSSARRPAASCVNR